MIRINNITADAHQRFTLQTSNGNITLIIRFMPTVESWFADIEYAGRARYGVRIASSVSELGAANYPFDLVCTEPDGVDPYRLDDFASGRCKLWLAGAAEVADYRGTEVRP